MAKPYSLANKFLATVSSIAFAMPYAAEARVNKLVELAWLHRGISAPIVCPNGSTYADGCASAPAATYQKSNFFSVANQSGQSYVTRPPWNVAGVDYAVGTTTPVTSLTDIASVGSSIPGCAYSSLYSSYAPALVCNSGSNPTISGYDFGPNAAFIASNGASGHDCVMLVVLSPVSGTVTIKNNRFSVGWSGSSVPSACVGGATTWTGSYPLGTNYPNSTLNGLNPLVYINDSLVDLDIENNEFDGNYLSTCCSTPVVNKSGVQAITYLTATAHNVTVEYNVFLNLQGKSFSASAVAGTNYVMDFNYIEGWQSRSPSGHGENVSVGGPYNSFTGSFNTVFATKDMCFCSTGVFWLQNNGGGAAVNFMTLDHNTVATNNPGGASSSILGTVSGTIDDGTGVGPGNVFTVTALSGGLASNIAVGDALVSSYGAVIYANVSGSGIGSKWLLDCSNGAAISSTNPCPATNGTNVTYPGPATTGVMYGTGYGQPITVTSVLFKGGYANDAVAQVDHATGVTISFHDNYIDGTGGYSGGIWGAGNSPMTCPVAASIINNVNLLTGDGTAVNGWTTNASTGGC